MNNGLIRTAICFVVVAGALAFMQMRAQAQPHFIGYWIDNFQSTCDTEPAIVQIDGARLVKTISYPKDCIDIPIVCTRSADGREEYVHVLTPSVGNARSIILPKPIESFTSAYNLRTRNPVTMKTLPDGRLELTLDDKDQWHELDTVIGLEIASSKQDKKANK